MPTQPTTTETPVYINPYSAQSATPGVEVGLLLVGAAALGAIGILLAEDTTLRGILRELRTPRPIPAAPLKRAGHTS